MNRLLVLYFCLPFLSLAQRTETAISLSSKLSRIDFELNNDMLFSTDSYYTAGLGLAYTNKKFTKTLAQFILKTKNENVINFSGFSIEQKMFTPSSIIAPKTIPKDQPYSAYLLLTNYSVNVNQAMKMKISNEIGIGLMGPQAYGEEMQTIVHRLVDVAEPIGWNDQLQNTLLLDYQIRIERGFGPDWFANHVIPFLGTRIGTLTDRVQIGTMIKFGNKNKYLTSDTDLEVTKKKIIWEWTFSANLQGVFYDATLQGSIFRNDPNALEKSDIISHQYQFRTGINFFYQNISLRYMVNFNSSNFNEAIYHRYGGINIGYSF